ncbi:MAG: hypothetical protein CL685_01285 [Candidatus Magasanikbacteria bacterium]|nr:hypothetical protein [Candidatus Magasanikbacteria bacterium]
MKDIVILLGVPGSGKGTQAQNLINKFGYCHISTGNLLRELEKKQHLTELEKAELEKMHNGMLVSDEFIYTLVFDAILACVNQKGKVILDGAIRTLEQAKRYHDFFVTNNIVEHISAVELHIPDTVIEERLRIRIESGEGRDDDKDPEAIKHRILLQGNTALAPIVDFYKQKGLLQSVDGTQSIGSVFTLLCDAIR